MSWQKVTSHNTPEECVYVGIVTNNGDYDVAEFVDPWDLYGECEPCYWVGKKDTYEIDEVAYVFNDKTTGDLP